MDYDIIMFVSFNSMLFVPYQWRAHQFYQGSVIPLGLCKRERLAFPCSDIRGQLKTPTDITMNVSFNTEVNLSNLYHFSRECSGY